MIYECRLPLVIAHKLLVELGAGAIDLDELRAESDHWATLLAEADSARR